MHPFKKDSYTPTMIPLCIVLDWFSTVTRCAKIVIVTFTINKETNEVISKEIQGCIRT